MPTIIRVGGGGGKAGIDLTVVGGTTQPTSPKNNTIWVKTETAIGTAYLSPTAPESPAVGDVWINTGIRYGTDSVATVSTKTIAVHENPFLEINVLQLNQWDGSAWNWCDGGIYANNEWTDMALYLTWYGTMNESYPVGYEVAKSDFTFRSDFVNASADGCLHWSGSSYNMYCMAGVKNGHGIDVSKFSKVGISYKTSTTDTSIITRVVMGFSTYVDANISSISHAYNAQRIDLSMSKNIKEVTSAITCTGIVRPTFFITLGSSTAIKQVYIYYWVLT